ncbi:MAG: hypothetical protein ACP5NX_04705 [Candidatus Bilamarchaeaceae archaeon]
MAGYRSWKTGEIVEIDDLNHFTFPPTGDKILLKTRPPIAKELKTD